MKPVLAQLVRTGISGEAGHVIGAARGVQQVSHPRGRDRQRPARTLAAEPRAEVQLALPGRQALLRDGLEDLQPGVVTGVDPAAGFAPVLELVRMSPAASDGSLANL
jgi:hypothetical protein